MRSDTFFPPDEVAGMKMSEWRCCQAGSSVTVISVASLQPSMAVCMSETKL